jgi:hypothetical protein
MHAASTASAFTPPPHLDVTQLLLGGALQLLRSNRSRVFSGVCSPCALAAQPGAYRPQPGQLLYYTHLVEGSECSELLSVKLVLTEHSATNQPQPPKHQG